MAMGVVPLVSCARTTAVSLVGSVATTVNGAWVRRRTPSRVSRALIRSSGVVFDRHHVVVGHDQSGCVTTTRRFAFWPSKVFDAGVARFLQLAAGPWELKGISDGPAATEPRAQHGQEAG